MPDRKYTYQIEIDAAQAKQAAAQLRALLQRELADIFTQSGQGAQNSAAPAQALRSEIEKIAKIDLTAPIDQLQAQIGETTQQINRLRAEYERATITGQSGRTPQEAAIYQDYINEVRRQVSERAANAIQSTGQYLNIGERGAQFKAEDEQAYITFADDWHKSRRDVQEKEQRTLQERIAIARLEAELTEADLQLAQAEKEIATRRIQQIERSLGETGDDENEIMRLLEAGQQAQEQLDQVSQQETYLLSQVADANDRLAQLLKQEAEQVQAATKRAALNAGDFSAASTTGAGTISRVQMTVSAASTENAERLAESYRKAAEQSERIAENTERISRAKISEARGVAESAKIAEVERRTTELAIKDAQRLATIEAEAAKQRTASKQQAMLAQRELTLAQQKQTIAAKAEADQRVAIARYEAHAKMQEETRRTIAARAEDKRITEAARREAEERRRIAANEAAAARKAQGGGGLSLGGLAWGVAGALGIYSIDQVARQIYSSGREGAMLERQAQTFEQVARRVGVSAAAMVNSIKAASRETITDAEAMGYATQILAQKWSSSSADIVGDTARLVEASRRLSQIFTDENGAFLTTQEVFARLVKYIREGNKELVDQFGISNARIAESLGITTKGLAAAGGASDRFRGLLKVLAEDMERIGPAMLTTADQFEQSEARITTAKQRIERSLAKPTAIFAEGLAAQLEGATVALGDRSPEAIRSFAEAQIAGSRQFDLIPRQELLDLVELFDRVDGLTGKAAESAAYYKAELAQLGAQIVYNEGAETDRLARLASIERQIELVATGQDAYTRAMQITTEEAINQDSRMMALVSTMGTYQRMYEEGAISLETYNRLSSTLAVTLFDLARAANTLAPALAATNAELAAVPSNPGLLGGSITGNLTQSPGWFAYRQQQDQFTQDRIDAQTARDRAAREEAKRAADAAQREWERAAKQAASDFERAAKASADAFKSALESVPGLFSSSEVTAEDMELAKAGVYEEKADEYLRRLADEVLNGKDYAGVDIRDAAARLGIDPNLDPKAILAKFTQAWNDSSLFAGGANLDLINKDAVESALARQEASKSGKEAILKFFGLEEADIEAAGAEARTQFVSGFTGPAAGAGEGGEQADFLKPILDGMDTGLQAGDAADRLYGIGGAIVGRIYAGFSDAANNLAWGKPILDSIAASVAPQVYDMLAAELPQ